MFRVHQTGTTTGTFSVCLFSSSNRYSFRNSDDYWQIYIPTSKARTVSCLERKRWRANHCCCDGASKGMEEACIASAIDRDSWLCNCYGYCIKSGAYSFTTSHNKLKIRIFEAQKSVLPSYVQRNLGHHHHCYHYQHNLHQKRRRRWDRLG